MLCSSHQREHCPSADPPPLLPSYMSDKAGTLSFSIFQSLVRSPARMLGSVFLNGQSSRPLPDLAEFDVGILIPYRTVQKWAQTGAETDQSSKAERVESPKRVEAQSLSFAAHHVRSSHTSAHRSTTFIQLPRDGTKLRTSSGLPMNSCPGVICAFWSERNTINLSGLSSIWFAFRFRVRDLTVALARLSYHVRRGTVA